MEITVHLPDDLTANANPEREALETLAIEGYRTGTFSHYQAAQLLGMDRFEFDGFLKERHISEHAYEAEDLKRDEQILRHLHDKGLLRA